MARRALWLVPVLVLLAAPLGLPPYLMTTLTEILIFGLFAMSLDLLVGYTGLYSFGHAAGFGIGAYTSALALLELDLPLPAAILLGAIVTGVVAVPVSWVCTRATGVAFAMLTVAFAQLAYAVAYKWQSVTGGSDGLVGVPRMAGPFDLHWLATKPGFYYLVLFCLALSLLLCRGFVRSPLGTTLEAIRENQRKAEALGYNARYCKIIVFVVASFFAGLAGALYAPFAGYASPELAFWLVSGQVLIMVIVGGARSLVGPLLGAAFFLLMEHYLSDVTNSWALLLGIVYIVFIIFVPQGLWGLASGWRRPALATAAPGSGAPRAEESG